MQTSKYFLITLLVVIGMVVVACGGAALAPEQPAEQPAEEQAAEQPVEEEAPEAAVEEVPAAEEAAADGEKVQVRWFVGLGTGQQPEQVEAQEAVVEAFNAAHDDIELVLEIVNYDVAVDTLSTQIAAGNPPDIVGPVGVGGSNAFNGQWLDLEPLVESTGYDLSVWDPAQVDFYRVEGQGLVGLPFGVFPSFIYYDKDAFDEAGLDYPPHEWGAPYADGDAWDYDKVAELAKILTVDAAGNDATMAEFDYDSVEQFGYYVQWTDPRGEATFRAGAGNFVEAAGEAQIPDGWADAFKWYHSAIFEEGFYPNESYINSDLLAQGNAFGSGNVAMVALHLWCHGCSEADNWDIAALPVNEEGNITAKLHADTFRIMNSTKHPEEAFAVLSYLLGDGAEGLLNVYGGMPARKDLQDAFFATLDEQHAQGVDWQVAIDALAYPDNPNHEAWMPNFNRANERIGAFQTLYRSTADLDVDAELEQLQADLQVIFDGAE